MAFFFSLSFDIYFILLNTSPKKFNENFITNKKKGKLKLLTITLMKEFCNSSYNKECIEPPSIPYYHST